MRDFLAAEGFWETEALVAVRGAGEVEVGFFLEEISGKSLTGRMKVFIILPLRC